MHVTYTPEDKQDGDRQVWDFDPARVRSSVAEVIEKRYGEPWDQFTVAVQQGNMRARRVMLWHLLSRDHIGLRYEDVPDFYAGELVVQFSVKELTALRERVEKASISPDKQEQALAGIDIELTDAMAREEAAAGPGKATSKSSASAGG